MFAMVNHKKYSDIIFKIGAEYIYAHRIVIKARCSSLFDAMNEVSSH
jgi:hypothetical protein